jgi:alkyl hydroperoxide reductase subunit D
MDELDHLRAALPAAAEDVSHNLDKVLRGGTVLSERQRWGVALASAYAARSSRLTNAVLAHASPLGEDLLEDARVAAVLMAQSNVYYRFRHLVEKPSYESKHPRLTMSRRSRVANKLDYELFALAVSAIHGCGSCVKHHESTALTLGAGEDHVNDAVRIAATLHATAIALEIV